MITVDGHRLVWRDKMTVTEVLVRLNDNFPYSVARIETLKDKKLERVTVVSINFDKHEVPDDSEIFFVPLIAGG